MQVQWNLGYPTMLSLFFNVLFILFLLLLCNRILFSLIPRSALTQAELLFLFVILSISSASAQFVEYLIPLIAGPFHLASPASEEIFGLQSPLARFLTVRESGALEDLSQGHSQPVEHLRVWIVPFIGWTAFIVILLFTTLCLGALFYRHWVDAERLPFPIVQIPLQITEEGGGTIFREPLFWLAFGFAGGLTCWNGLASWFPFIPPLPIKRQILADLRGYGLPLSVLGFEGILYYSLHPFVVGLGYFLPLDLTFSVGMFYALQQGVRFCAATMGFAAEDPLFPHLDYQAFGAWMMLCGMAVWFVRAHLRQVWRQAIFGERSTAIDSGHDVPLSYRRALLGMTGGVLLLYGFIVGLGMTFWAGAVFLFFYFALVTAMARARAELGPPAVDLSTTAPGTVMVVLFGGASLGPETLFVMALLYWLYLEYPWHPLGHQVEAFRIAERQRIHPRWMLKPLMVFALLGWAVSFYLVLQMDYTQGATTAAQPGQTQVWYAQHAYGNAQRWTYQMTSPDLMGIVAIGVGGLLTLLLTLARLRLVWWPLHPVGYALVGASTTTYLWLPLWMSCLFKGSILRYGGLRAFRRFQPLFLGLVMGEFVFGGFWAALSVLIGQRLYVFWPY